MTGNVKWSVFVILAIVLTSCAPAATPTTAPAAPTTAPAAPKIIRIGISFPGESPYVTYQGRGVEDAAAAAGVEVTIVNARWDPAAQSEQLRDLVARGVDAIAVMPMDAKAIVSVAAEIRATYPDMPILNFNSPVYLADAEGAKNFIGFVGPSDEVVAQLMAVTLAEALGGKGNIMEVKGQAGHIPTKIRDEAFREALEAYPDIKVIDAQNADWDTNKAISVTRDMITRNQGNFQAIWAQDDMMAAGAVEALKAAGYEKGEILVGGGNAVKVAVDLIKEGWMYCTVMQDPYEEGGLVVQTLLRYLNGEKIPEITLLNQFVVSPENVDQIEPRF